MSTIQTIGIDLVKNVFNIHGVDAQIGLIPRQHTTGSHIQLGRISKRGDTHILTLSIHGARAVIARCKDRTDRNRLWIQKLVERRGYK